MADLLHLRPEAERWACAQLALQHAEQLLRELAPLRQGLIEVPGAEPFAREPNQRRVAALGAGMIKDHARFRCQAQVRWRSLAIRVQRCPRQLRSSASQRRLHPMPGLQKNHVPS